MKNRNFYKSLIFKLLFSVIAIFILMTLLYNIALGIYQENLLNRILDESGVGMYDDEVLLIIDEQMLRSNLEFGMVSKLSFL